MIRTALATLFLLSASTLAMAQDTPSKEPQPTSVKELVAGMQAAEKAVDGVVMEMSTKGRYPGGTTFEIEGSIRVLGATHFHISTKATFEESVTAESETVKTPEGVWMREKDPAFGEVYTVMSPETVAQLAAASEALGEETNGPGGVGQAKDPLGSKMLSSLDTQFDLAVAARELNGEAYYVVAGGARADAPEDESSYPTPDRVELLVRQRDLAVVQMVQFRNGKELMKIEILRLDLNPQLEPASFRIELPEGKQFIDVMEHPPAAAYIRNTLERAAQQQKDPDDQKK